MPKITKESVKELANKLKYIGLDFENIPDNIKEYENIGYKPQRGYDETKYRIYRYVNAKEIQILLSPTDRITSMKERYEKASPIYEFFMPETEEGIQKHAEFLEMLNKVEIEEIEEIEQIQKELEKEIPFEIRYEGSYLWQIYYSDSKDKYFMLVPMKDSQYAPLFYLLKKKLEKKDTKLFIPIADAEYSGKYLKKSELGEIENYLWLFTGEWPTIYEVYDKKENMTIQIVGTTKVYDKITSSYKIGLKTAKEAKEFYKLIKALFIMQTELPKEYHFIPQIGPKGSLEFYDGTKKITYQNISEYIEQQYKKQEKVIEKIENQIIKEEKNLERLQNISEEKLQEYLKKEKQIVTFLECKRTFFGRIRYFLKSKKENKVKQKEELVKELVKQQGLEEEPEKEEYEIPKFELKNNKVVTIEDLIDLSKVRDEKEQKIKNINLDKIALENKIENMTRKVENANQYLEEIDSHKKSIFEFWKYTNKDNVLSLNQGEEKKQEEKVTHKIEKVFEYEDDIEELGKKVDEQQRNLLSNYACDAAYIFQEIGVEAFKHLENNELLKEDLKILKQELEKQGELEQDIDIFGNSIAGVTTLKTIKNQKHREIEKNKFKILQISKKTTVKEYKETLKNLLYLLDENYDKIEIPYSVKAYKLISEQQKLNQDNYEIFSIEPQSEVCEHVKEEENNYILYKLNLKENMPMLFYTNIMFYDNQNKTLPLGMDLSTQILVNLKEFNLKQIATTKFRISQDSKIRNIEVIEYQVERKEKK